jgi:S-DNA-T family DNA segregation ATPase FtsK/SpoIIIE
VIGLADDIARSMSAISARVAVVPGRNAIGIELPNSQPRNGVPARAAGIGDFEKGRAKAAALRWARTSAASPLSPIFRACRTF